MSYDRSNIIKKFRGLIGFRPTLDASNVDADIDVELAKSLSGKYVNTLHALFTPENFSAAAQQFSEFTQLPWQSTTLYLEKQVVEHNSSIYVALRDNTGQSPDTSPDDWKQTTLLSEWYRSVYDSAVLDAVDATLTQKKIEGHGKQLKGNVVMFSTDSPKSNLVQKSGRKVGFEIKIKEAGIGVILERIGLQLNQAQDVPVTIRFRGEDRIETLEYTFNKDFQYFDLEDAQFSAYNGPLQIFYDENDLGSASAIYQNTQIFTPNYGTCCGGIDSGATKAWSTYSDISPIIIDDDGEVQYVTNTNFGLNLVLSYVCDFSDFIVRNKSLFVPLLEQRLLKFFMEQLANSTRYNVLAENVSNLAFDFMKDYSNPEHPSTLTKRELRALSFEMTGRGIYGPCVTCQKVKIRDRRIG